MGLKTIFNKLRASLSPPEAARKELRELLYEGTTTPEAVRPLIEKYPKLLTTSLEKRHPYFPLEKAIHRNDLTLVQLFLAQNPELVRQKGMDGIPLHTAKHANPAIVELLLNSGADINARNFFKKTPLMCAGNDQIETLLKYNPDIHAKGGHYNRTALMYAAIDGHEGVEPLIKAGSVIEEKDSTGKTALMHALYIFDETKVEPLAAARILLEHGAKIDLDSKLLKDVLEHGSGPDHARIKEIVQQKIDNIQAEAEKQRHQEIEADISVFKAGLKRNLPFKPPFRQP